jgi:hypothetical protein
MGNFDEVDEDVMWVFFHRLIWLKSMQTSAVQVSQIFYRNIWGTSATKQAIKLACSPLTPCTGLRFENINLMPATKSKPNITSFCQSAQGVVAGIIVPNLDCLQSPQPRWDLSSFE